MRAPGFGGPMMPGRPVADPIQRAPGLGAPMPPTQVGPPMVGQPPQNLGFPNPGPVGGQMPPGGPQGPPQMVADPRMNAFAQWLRQRGPMYPGMVNQQ
jgi:hypothetical protein